MWWSLCLQTSPHGWSWHFTHRLALSNPQSHNNLPTKITFGSQNSITTHPSPSIKPWILGSRQALVHDRWKDRITNSNNRRSVRVGPNSMRYTNIKVSRTFFIIRSTKMHTCCSSIISFSLHWAESAKVIALCISYSYLASSSCSICTISS